VSYQKSNVCVACCGFVVLFMILVYCSVSSERASQLTKAGKCVQIIISFKPGSYMNFISKNKMFVDNFVLV